MLGNDDTSALVIVHSTVFCEAPGPLKLSTRPGRFCTSAHSSSLMVDGFAAFLLFLGIAAVRLQLYWIVQGHHRDLRQRCSTELLAINTSCLA